jgi:hypothetical protein
MEQCTINTATPADYRSKVNKIYINQLIREAILEWKDNAFIMNDWSDHSSCLLLIEHLSLHVQLCNKVDKYEVTADYICKNVFDSKLTRSKVGEILRKLEQANLLTYTVKGRKRLRSWVITDDLYF